MAPESWRYEFMNVLSTYCRQKLMTIEQALDAFTRATAIVGSLPVDPEPARVLTLSLQSGCSGYDCVFVAAAQMNGLRLVTSDQRILAAFPQLAVRPDQFPASGS